MRINRKWVAFLPLVAACGVLAGCGKNEDEATPPTVPAGKSDAGTTGGAKQEPAFAGAGGLPSASGPAPTK